MATTLHEIENLAKELDNKYPFSRYSTNYGQILRGVANKTIVHDIIADISEIVFGISREPYYMSQYKPFLYGYMNECIANVYEKGENTSIDGFCEAWINIREHENKKTVRERIEQIAKSRGLEVDITKKNIHKTFHEFEHNYKMLKQFSYGSNGYNQYLPLSKNGAALLLEYKFDPYGLPYGLGWSSNIFTEVEREQRKARGVVSQEKYLNERRAYWRKVAEEEGKAPGFEAKKVKDPNSLSAWQIILMIIVGGLFGWLIAEAGSLLLLFALFIGALFLKCLR